MRLWIVTFVALIGAAATGGWFTAVLPETLAIKSSSSAIAIPSVEHAGIQIALAYNQLQKLDLISPPLSEPIDTVQHVADDPIEVVLRKQISAVVGAGRSAVLVTVDDSKPSGRRYLKIGQEFKDGWIVSSILPQEIVLKRKGELKQVPLFAKLSSDTVKPPSE